MKPKISIISSTRAEFGILRPLITELFKDNELDIRLCITGSHLSNYFGNTFKEIQNEGIIIDKKIPIIETKNDDVLINETISKAILKFSDYFQTLQPDIVVLLGDRYEIFAIAVSAFNLKIPIAHIHGGEVTEGASDDMIRHSITKLSKIHFTSTEKYRKRVIQLGENPSFVYNVGALGMDNIFSNEFYSKEDVYLKLGLSQDADYAIVTYHPETLGESAIKEIKILLDFCSTYTQLNFIFTKANADQLGIHINEEIFKATLKSKNIKLFESLGSKLYLSALKYSKFVMGNSSSGILEAPFLNVRTINIGERQKGRIQTSSIINVGMLKSQLLEAVEEILNNDVKPINVNKIYGDGDTSIRIKRILKEELNKGIYIKKEFFDL